MAIAQATTAQTTQYLTENIYERLFSDEGQHFDLYEGTVNSPGGAKVVYLSTDIIAGIYQAIKYEAGDAWMVILKSCGKRWGKRVAGALEKEMRSVLNRKFDALTVTEYVELLEQYFAYHGWGNIRLNLDGVEKYGIVQADLKDGIFKYALPQVTGSVDYLIAGMLIGISEQISQTQLDVLQVDSTASDGSVTTHMLLTVPERIEWGQAQVDAGVDFQTLLLEMRQS
jgi:uncharacterized protein